jgi:hypothetical protein
VLPEVSLWTAWNEPNNPLWLAPQYKRVGKTWRIESAYEYARSWTAVSPGFHSDSISVGRPVPGEQVACGVTEAGLDGLHETGALMGVMVLRLADSVFTATRACRS